MNKFVGSIGFLLMSVLTAHSTAFPLCGKQSLLGGELLYLTDSKAGHCWKAKKDSTLTAADFANYGDSYYFSYIFGNHTLNDDFDPIFNVQIKERADDNSNLENSVEIFRDEMTNLCLNGRLQKIDAKRAVARVKRQFISGSVYNSYHQGRKQDAGKLLGDFHVWFLSARKICERTDDTELKALFSIEGIEFAANSGFLAALSEGLFGVPHAFAKGPDAKLYRKITVEIGRGEFRSTLYSASFSVAASASYDVILNDLSSYIGFGNSSRRRPIKFSISE